VDAVISLAPALGHPRGSRFVSVRFTDGGERDRWGASYLLASRLVELGVASHRDIAVKGTKKIRDGRLNDAGDPTVYVGTTETDAEARAMKARLEDLVPKVVQAYEGTPR
jgi:hypothetical protein